VLLVKLYAYVTVTDESPRYVTKTSDVAKVPPAAVVKVIVLAAWLFTVNKVVLAIASKGQVS